MKRKQYLADLFRLLTAEEIKRSAQNPTAYMTRTHVLLHYIALKKLNFL